MVKAKLSSATNSLCGVFRIVHLYGAFLYERYSIHLSILQNLIHIFILTFTHWWQTSCKVSTCSYGEFRGSMSLQFPHCWITSIPKIIQHAYYGGSTGNPLITNKPLHLLSHAKPNLTRWSCKGWQTEENNIIVVYLWWKVCWAWLGMPVYKDSSTALNWTLGTHNLERRRGERVLYETKRTESKSPWLSCAAYIHSHCNRDHLGKKNKKIPPEWSTWNTSKLKMFLRGQNICMLHL